MSKYRFILEPYKGMNTRYRCPAPDCGKGKTFTRYIDKESGEHLHPRVGRCSRESNCGYHYKPKQYFQDNNISPDTDRPKAYVPRPVNHQPKPIFYIPAEVLMASLKGYEQNTFIQNLFYTVRFPFEVDDVTKAIELYRLGTVASGYRAGANTFPFIDTNGNVRAIQVKQFNNENRTTSTDFLHSIVQKHYTRNNKPLPEWLEEYTKQEKIISCLFGEHLLNKYPNNHIALVEAPKTAVYGTLYFGLPETPEDLLFLAVYNKSSFSFDKLKVLQGRVVYVFPDLSKDGNTFKEWENKAKEYERRLTGTRFIFSDLLELLAPEEDKIEGYDLADYLIKLDWRQFRKRNTQEPQPEPEQELLMMNDSEFSEGSLEVHRMFQERNIKRLEMTKEESYKAIEFFIDNDTDTYRI